MAPDGFTPRSSGRDIAVSCEPNAASFDGLIPLGFNFDSVASDHNTHAHSYNGERTSNNLGKPIARDAERFSDWTEFPLPDRLTAI